VSIVAVGTCTLRADQSGSSNYSAAPQVTADVSIFAVVPKAPTIGAATGGNQFARVNFTPPADDGGTAITGYVATCNPGGITGNGATSPVTVTGLTNGAGYTCSVAATNAAGTGASSGTVGVMPNLQGAALWVANCQTCHGPTPGGARFNYAGTSLSTQVLDYVIATNPDMNIPAINALNSLERLDLKGYISSFLTPITESTLPNLPKTISVGTHLSLNTVFPSGGAPGSFSHVVVDTPPTNGTLSVFNGVEVVYTPNPGYTGPDSFSYHGQRTSPVTVTGDTHTVTINVTAGARLLTVSKTGTGTGLVFSDSPTSGIDCGSDCSEAYSNGVQVALIAVANPGTTFIGWTGDCTGTSAVCNVTMSAARNVTAVFDLTPFDLALSFAGAGAGSVVSAPGGISCNANCTAGFAPTTVVTLTPTPAAGSAFTGWSGACSGTGACLVTMDASKAVTATFQPTYVLTVAKSGLGTGTVSSSPPGIACGATCNAAFLTGTVVSLTPTPAAGSAFTGWSGDCTGTGACSVTMTAAHNVTANFTPTYTLTVTRIGNGVGTVTSNPAGISCGATCSADYLDTTVVNLSAAIGADTEFLGWGGACSGTGACSVTMSAARSVTANFKSSIALTVNRIGTGSGIVTSAPDGVGISCGASCSVGFDPGTVVTLGVSPAAGSVFAGWTGACTGTGACILTMSQSRTVTATFNLASGPQADLSIVAHSSTPPAAASIGQQVTFTLTVANNGPAAATAVVLTDNIPSGSTFVSASAACVHAAGVVTCALGTMASGASMQLSVTVQPNAAGGATNFASVTAAESDPLPFNNASALAIAVSGASNVRLGNISTRMQVQGGTGGLIGGFVIGAGSNKTVAIVATGPSLAAFGITGALANPALTLVRSSDQAVIATNDNWQTAANAAQLTAAGFAPSNPLEAAILVNLAPGAYTALVTGGTGVAVLGVYEVDQPQVRLINISTRGMVLTGNDVMIGGFVVSGNAPQTVAIQGVGPSLTAYGITNPLANPTIALVRSSDQVVLATNDDWQSGANALALQASGFAPSNPLESGLLVTLPPGAYTVILSGASSTTGIGIIGIYTVD
jgi:uncharacterized repeat protein (TIGR01451 family)/uncharacterized repeat protein (TIGR02543 family)